ncbi:MAG: outer membrane protein assembly factor BamB family protein [Planctomycetaceae bacterium]
MPVIEIRHRSGKTETRELSKQTPLLVGRLATNDIQLDEDGVDPVHCRISWNRRQFEVAAVTSAGVQHNGATVRIAPLKTGDVVRVGEIDLALLDERPRAVAALAGIRPSPPHESPALEDASASASIELKPVTEDSLPVRSFRMTSPPQVSAPPVESPVPAARAPARKEAVDDDEAESEREEFDEDLPPDLADIADIAEAPEEAEPLPPRTPKAADPGLAGVASRLRRSMQSTPHRPGEQEVLRSPLVLLLAVAVGLLLLSAATIWFVLERQRTQREYDAAQAAMEAGMFAQAIEGFEEFVREHPRHRLAPPARLAISEARVNQPLAGAVPVWEAGLEALNRFVSENLGGAGSDEPESPARKFVQRSADRIAIGAAEGARAARRRPLLAVSADARKLLELYSPADPKLEERLTEIARVAREAEAAINEREAFDSVVQKFDAARDSGKLLAALPDYRRLVDRHSNAAEYRPLQDRVGEVLSGLRALVARDQRERVAQSAAPTASVAPRPLVLARRNRARSDVASVGGTVFATAEGAVFGVDSATGEPLWRRFVGQQSPFTPLPVTSTVPALLLFDTFERELLLVHQRTGETIWRLALDETPTAAPLIYEAQALLATAAGTLEQIDLQTGASHGRLQFPQRLAGPAVVSPSGQRLYLIGESDVMYVLTHRPLACERVVWLGHGPGSIVAPPMMLRAYLLLAENDRTDMSRLRLLDTTREDQPPATVAQADVTGLIRDPLAVRGRQLAVPSTTERVSAFTLAETGDAGALTFVASYAVQEPQGGPVFVSVGPDDELWMLSTALRRLTISRNSLLPDKQQVAVGLAAQPLFVRGESLYVARHVPCSRAVVFSEIERQRLATQWQTALGAAVLAATPPTADGSVVCVTSLGDFMQVTPQALSNGGFETQALGQISAPDTLRDPLFACTLPDGRLTIRCGGQQPRLWLAGGDGNAREFQLTHELQADPVLLDSGILLPLAGRLRLLPRPDRPAAIEDLIAPLTAEGSPAWRSLAVLDDSQALALNASGRLARVQYRISPVAHLAEVAAWDAGREVDVGFACDGGRVVVADASGRVSLLDARSFEPLGDPLNEQRALRAPWIVGDLAFIETLGQRLICCELEPRLARRWELESGDASLVGSPLPMRGRLIVAFDDGRVAEVDPADGKVLRTLSLRQRLAHGPALWGDALVVGTIDGALLKLNSLWNSER